MGATAGAAPGDRVPPARAWWPWRRGQGAVSCPGWPIGSGLGRRVPALRFDEVRAGPHAAGAEPKAGHGLTVCSGDIGNQSFGRHYQVGVRDNAYFGGRRLLRAC